MLLPITHNFTVPTGNILVAESSMDSRSLEFLSLADYGKDHNVKCDAMGLTRDLNQVVHVPTLPLTEKWVVTISTQFGCSSGCIFCDVPAVGPGVNIPWVDLVNQVETALALHPEVTHTKRLNVHYARMGEPTWNDGVLVSTQTMKRTYQDFADCFHPVVSTMMPRHNTRLSRFLQQWVSLKHSDDDDVGLQISMNSTDDEERRTMFNGSALSVNMVANVLNKLLPYEGGRKITLNFALADWTIDPGVLSARFDPKYYLIKLTPMHRTASAMRNQLATPGDYTTYYPYRDIESKLKQAGYDVLVFLASAAEDDSLITCGNAVLSGSRPTTT